METCYGKIRRFCKIPFYPYWKLRRVLSSRYYPKRYWKKRHQKHTFDFRGVGDRTLTHRENQELYQQAREVFLSLCRKSQLDFSTINMLDIGCGTGFYAEVFHENRGNAYLGIDITDVLFKELKKRFPEFEFRKQDITKQKVKGSFDLINMIDVTQHIVDSKAFSLAMQNVRSALSKDGMFVVTSWLSDEITKRQPYEVARPMHCYTREFPGYAFSEPVSFRDKYIFVIRKNPVGSTVKG